MDYKWAIRCHYTTGDSDNSWESNIELPMRWNDIEKAKAALAKIRAVYIIDQQLDHGYFVRNRKKLAAELKELLAMPEVSNIYNGISFELDDGTLQPMMCPWRGHFERLLSADIIKVLEQPDDNDMRFAPSELPYDFWKTK